MRLFPRFSVQAVSVQDVSEQKVSVQRVSLENFSAHGLSQKALPLLSVCSSLLLLAGCAATVHTPYQSPGIDLPNSFPHAAQVSDNGSATSPPTIRDDWWTAFGEPQLNQWVSQALAANSDLALAAIRIQQAREQAGLSRDNQRPKLGANASASTSRNLNTDTSQRGLSLNGSVSYEVDLFGKLSRAQDAAEWEATATEQDREAAKLALIASLCQLYFQHAYIEERITTTQANLATSQQLERIIRVRHREGAVSGIEVANAAQSVASQHSTLADLQQQKVETRNAISLLIQQPFAVTSGPTRLSTTALPAIPAELPTSVLSRRPDLKAAEMRLQKTLANSDATRASYYPSISLTGGLGFSSSSLGKLLSNPVASLGAGISLPFLQYRQMQRAIAISELDYEAAITSFRKSLYQALVDVDNALSARQQLLKQVESAQTTLTQSQKAERLTRIRYQNGAIDLQTLLNAEQSRRQAEATLIQLKQQQLTNAVTLLQSLGGSAKTS